MYNINVWVKIFILHFSFNLLNISRKMSKFEIFSYKIFRVVSKLYLQRVTLIGPSQKRSKTFKTPQCRSIHSKQGTYKPQYWPSYVGSKRLMLGKSSVKQNEVLLGTCCGMHWELEKDVGNPLGT